MPGQATLDLLQVAIQTSLQHLADLAPVLVNLDPLDRYRLPYYRMIYLLTILSARVSLIPATTVFKGMHCYFLN